MTDFDHFERRLAAALRSDADERVGPFEAESIARAAIAGTRPARRFGRGRGMTLLAAAALLLVGGALAAGSSLLRLPSIEPPVPGPSVIALATASPDATSAGPSPSAAATPVPIATTAPITWTEASLMEDWPAPVRTEPAGGARVELIQKEADGIIPDPVGDTGSAGHSHPWVDINELQGVHVGGMNFYVEFASNLLPLVAPSEQWIAYGVVVDDDRDGIPDRRFGIDNIPGTAPGKQEHRVWITDLKTGRTVVGDVRGGYVGETRFDTFYPGEWAPGSGARLGFGASLTNGGSIPGLVNPFYVWASVIQDGQIMATDYAPDVGWLDLSADAKP